MNRTMSDSSIIGVQIRVLRALLLRDTRARFGAGFFGYLVAIGIPFIHLVCLMILPLIVDQIAPIGTDYALFVATGVLPYILCLYPARMTMLCLADSASLLGFPIVKPLDVIAARAILEIAVALTVTVLFLLVLLVIGIEVVPHDHAEATAAILSTIYLGVSIGTISAILLRVARTWLFIQIGLLILMYVTSGTFFWSRSLPAEIRQIIWYNPLFHCVEWMRLSYYEGYGDELLSRHYLLGVSTGILFASVLLERLIRGRLVGG
jgi:capsular polysaccharide transport system permease protein